MDSRNGLTQGGVVEAAEAACVRMTRVIVITLILWQRCDRLAIRLLRRLHKVPRFLERSYFGIDRLPSDSPPQLDPTDGIHIIGSTGGWRGFHVDNTYLHVQNTTVRGDPRLRV